SLRGAIISLSQVGPPNATALSNPFVERRARCGGADRRGARGHWLRRARSRIRRRFARMGRALGAGDGVAHCRHLYLSRIDQMGAVRAVAARVVERGRSGAAVLPNFSCQPFPLKAVKFRGVGRNSEGWRRAGGKICCETYCEICGAWKTCREDF